MSYTNSAFSGSKTANFHNQGIWDKGHKKKKRKIPREVRMIIEETKSELKRFALFRH